MTEIEKINTRIKELKTKITALWDEKKTTDPEILKISLEMDRLYNKYHRLMTKLNNNPMEEVNKSVKT